MPAKANEFKGVSFSAPSEEVLTSDIEPIVNVNANWISIVPYAFLKDNEVLFNSKWQWWGEKPEGIRQTIKLSKELGLKIMLKPHVWIGHGDYSGVYSCDSERDWLKFEKSYTSYIMTFVDIAIEEEVEMFCIGTEWGKAVAIRPEYWKGLIKDIREKYKGKLTYAANWDDFDKVSFWSELDYIGIDSYFPLSTVKNPNVKQLVEGWKIISSALEKFSERIKKDILFTEFGFKSSSDATIKPWEFDSKAEFSEETQNNAFQSFFKTIWMEDWFKGGFVWKWFRDHINSGGKGDTDFTPQNKKAEETIRNEYSKS